MKSNDLFQHFVITQFNLRKFPSGVENKNEWIEWTRERIILFKTYCLPSFLNQTNKNFTWLIYFDKETPSEFHYLFEELNNVPFIKICFAEGFDNFKVKYLIDIKELSLNAHWIISTRCDNDDCLEKDAIATIQNYFTPKDGFLISLASGYTLNINDKTLSHYYYPMSPFISLIETNDNKKLKGIFYKEHTKWKGLKLKIYTEIFNKKRMSIFALQKPFWIQIIHGDNVSNSYKRGFPVVSPKNLSNFGISQTTKGQSIFNIPGYYNYVLWKRYFKSFIVRLICKR